MIALAALLGSGAVAMAQTPPASPGEKVPEGQKAPPEIAPPSSGKDENSGTSGKDESLSDQLSRDKGVIKPPPSGAPDMTVKPPVPEPNTTPVIPPPGSPGGNQDVVPK